MKWSESVSQINAEIAKSNTPDPEINYIDVDMKWRPYSESIRVQARIADGKIKTRRC